VYFLLSSRKGSKPQRDFSLRLCAFPALRDLFFSREGTKPAYGRRSFFARVYFLLSSRKVAKPQRIISFFAPYLLCESAAADFFREGTKPACRRLSFFARVYFLLSSRKGAEPQRKINPPFFASFLLGESAAADFFSRRHQACLPQAIFLC
jgi:hypothetical protein